MSYDKLPPGLKKGNYFCLYKLEPGNNGKEKKVPYQTCGARTDPGNKAQQQILQMHMQHILRVVMTVSVYRLWMILLALILTIVLWMVS